MVRKSDRLRATAATAASQPRSAHSRTGGTRTGRLKLGLAALGATTALVLTACGGGGDTSTPTEPAEPAETATSEPDPNAVQRALIGMHIEGVEGGAWASAPFGSLRL